MSASLQEWEEKFIAYHTMHAASEDAAHGIHHFTRVWKTCCAIQEAEGGKADLLVLLTASYFHDLISPPKNSPDRSKASLLSAAQAGELLQTYFVNFPKEKIEGVKHAIHAHSFSAGVTPVTPEARILQDADRMEALGAIGIARTFYVAGLMHTQLFHPTDPLARQRPLDDKAYALDHFQVKLLQLPGLMHTRAGKQIALQRTALLTQFMEAMAQEATGIAASY